MKQHETGFSLIELMVVVLIIGILAAIAIPSYTAQQLKSRRSDAQAALTAFANAMERYYSRNNSYLGAGSDTNDNGINNSAGAPLSTIFPSQTPIGGSTPYYNLTILGNSTATTYTLQATPIGEVLGDGLGEGILQLTSTGIRRWDRNDDGDTTDPGETW